MESWMRCAATGILVSSSTPARADVDPGSLARLHDVVAPPAVSWWPLAPGWFGLGVALCSLAAWWLWQTRIRRQRNRYRLEALTELAALRDEKLDARDLAGALMTLLKRTALTAYPRTDLAALNGEAWWQYLDERNAGSRFTSRFGAALEALAYHDPFASRRTAKEDMPHLLDAVENWIRDHGAPPSRDHEIARTGTYGSAPRSGGA